MNKIDDGGQVHPGEQGHDPDGKWNQTYEWGINRRDLGAIEMAASLVPYYAEETTPSDVAAAEIAKAAYLIIDALIKEGKK